GAGAEGGVVGPGADLEGEDVVLQPTAAAEAALEVASGTRPGVEHRAEAVAVGERVVRLPLVLEQLPALGDLRRPGGRTPDDRQPVREELPVGEGGDDGQEAQPEQPALGSK